jgi:triacylglycerol lipase
MLLLPPAALLVASALPAASGFVVQSVERRARVPWSRGRIATLSRETAAQALFSALRPLPWPVALPSPPTAPTRAAETPILLVPCPLRGRASMAFLATFLRSRGAVVWTSAPLTAPDHGLADQAAHLDRQLDELLVHTGAPRADLVCHGIGGLAAAWLLRHGDRADRVHRLVTMGTPWAGTRMAAFLPGRAAVETRPEAHHLDGLRPPCVPTVSIWCPDDPAIVPAEAAIADPLASVAIEGAGHAGLLLSARSFRAVWDALGRALPGEPT